MRWLLGLLFSFKGRTNRAKFWLYFLFLFLFTNGIQAVPEVSKRPYSGSLAVVGLILITTLVMGFLAISAKRLHDQNISAWWLFVYFGVPLGLLWAEFVFESFQGVHPNVYDIASLTGPAAWCMLGYILTGWAAILAIGGIRGTRGDNRFGPDPLGPKAEVSKDQGSL